MGFYDNHIHSLIFLSSTLELDYKTLKDMPANKVWQLAHVTM